MSRMRLIGTLALVGTALATVPARADGPFQYNSLSPCRVFDSRNAGAQANFTFTGQPLLNQGPANPVPLNVRLRGVCGVVAAATAVTVNVTIVGPSHAGNLTLYPSNLAVRPVVSNINYAALESALGNGGIVPLAPAGGASDLSVYLDMAVIAPGGSAHVVLDVTGYFAP